MASKVFIELKFGQGKTQNLLKNFSDESHDGGWWWTLAKRAFGVSFYLPTVSKTEVNGPFKILITVISGSSGRLQINLEH